MSCSELIKGLFAFSCLFISGCASMNVIKPSQVTNGRWDHILQSGISEDASHNLFLQKVNSQGKSQAFRPTDKQVTWWALFSMSSFPSPYHVVFQAKWYDPGGQIFFEEEFSLNSMMDSTFVKTSLPIADSLAATLPGAWAVNIIYQGISIDRKEFRILPSGFSQSDAASASDQWKSKDGDSLFESKLNNAKYLFRTGHYEEAEKEIESLLKVQPQRAEAHLALAGVYAKEEKWDAAFAQLDIAAQDPVYHEKALALRRHLQENAPSS